MTRTEALERITSLAAQLDDEQLETLAAYTAYLAGPTVYSQLSDAQKAEIDDARAQIRRGDGIPGDQVFARLNAKLKNARV